MRNVKEVRIGYEPTGATVLHTLDQKAQSHSPGAEKSVLTGLNLDTLRITLTNGQVIEIELFERIPGHISVSGDNLIVRPSSGNQVCLTHSKPDYTFWDREEKR